MDFSKYIKKFLDIGLTEREAKVYMTLLKKQMFTASELQRSVDIPRTKIYEVLQKMINHGLCIERRLGRNKIYEAIKPEIAFQAIIDNYQENLNRKKEIIKELNEKLMPVFEQNKDIVNSLDYIEVLNEDSLLHQKYLAFVKKTNHELLTFNKAPYASGTKQKAKEQRDVLFDLLKRGGVSKGLYAQNEFDQYGWMFKKEMQNNKFGHQGRIVDEIPVKMIVFDDKAVMFALNEPASLGSKLTMITIEHSDIAKASKMLFNHLWESGRSFEANI